MSDDSGDDDVDCVSDNGVGYHTLVHKFLYYNSVKRSICEFS